MVLRSRNARTIQTRRRSRELRRVLVSGPITALVVGGTRQAIAVDARRVRKD